MSSNQHLNTTDSNMGVEGPARDTLEMILFSFVAFTSSLKRNVFPNTVGDASSL